MSIRLPYVFAALALTTPLLTMANTQDAEACSISYQRSLPPEWSESKTFPANGIFYAEFEERYNWVDEQGNAIEFEGVMDQNLPELLDIRRPVTPLVPGQKIRTEGCEHEDCVWTIGEEDTTAPPMPRITDIEVYIDRKRRFQRTRYVDACGSGSGDDHSLSFDLEFDEEIEDADLHTIWVSYMGDHGDKNFVQAPPTEEHVTRFSGYHANKKKLGYMTELSEANMILRPDGPFCFRAALMDAAGNVSPWSSEQCVDPTDRRASYVSGPGACSITPLGGASMPAPQAPLLGLLLLFGLVALGVRRRRA